MVTFKTTLLTGHELHVSFPPPGAVPDDQAYDVLGEVVVVLRELADAVESKLEALKEEDQTNSPGGEG